MDITNLTGITSDYLNNYASTKSLTETPDNSFGAVFNSMIGAIGETNYLQNKAEEEEIRFALGYAENTHDLTVAESKAQIALQYTVAVRDKIIDAYKELMQMQI